MLTDAVFNGAEIQGANFAHHFLAGTGISATQLYSTNSYRNHDLSGVRFDGSNLSAAILANQNLSEASFQNSNLQDANLQQSNLTNAYFGGANVSGVNFIGADARGVQYLYTDVSGIANFIQPNGHIAGLSLASGQILVVRNYEGDPANNIGPISLFVEKSASLDPGSTLRVEFDSDPWNSLVSFAPGISVALAGSLDLEFTGETDPASQVGRSFSLFDWTDATPSGTFTIVGSYVWDTSHLYETGIVTLVAVPEPNSLSLAFGAIAGIATVMGVFRTLERLRFGPTIATLLFQRCDRRVQQTGSGIRTLVT